MGMGKRRQRFGTALALCATLAATGCTSLPTKRSMAMRRYVGQYIAWPYEHLLKRTYDLETRVDAKQDPKRLDAAVRAARASLATYQSSPEQAPVQVIKLTGTGYERGYAMGVVLNNEIIENVQHMMGVADQLAWPSQLDAKWREIAPYTAKDYLDELRGMADGSGISLKLLERMHAIPEITEQSCSGWAIDNGISADGDSYHIRILDYATYFRVQEHPLIAIHEPTDAQGHRIGYRSANIAWAGFVGSVGGVNERGLAIGEISGGKADALSHERGDGEPMTALVRRALTDAGTLDEAVATIHDARRTMRYVYVMSDRDGSAKVFSGPEFFQTYTDGDSIPKLGAVYDAMPGFPELTYHGANHLVHAERFTAKHEQLTFDDIVEHARKVALRKNLQIWIYNRETQEVWLGNAIGVKGRAVDQPLTRIPLGEHWGDRP